MRPRLAACILITLANTRRWLGRETNCIPRRSRSECNYMTSHNSVFSSCLLAPLYLVLAPTRRKDQSPFRTQRREAHTCKSRLRKRSRRTRGNPFLRGDILPSFSCRRRAHILQCSFPELSNVLRCSSTRSTSTDR